MSEINLNFSDWIKKIENGLGKEEWVTVYSYNSTDCESLGFYCALIPNDKIMESLDNTSWDLHIGDGLPGFVCSYENGKENCEYKRFLDGGIEPLVICRDFYGLKKNYKEISEEFRLFHNLYEDRINNKFINIGNDGDEEDAVLMSEKEIKIKLKYLKDYLAVKQMHLAILFDFNRDSSKTIEEIGVKEINETIKRDKYSYSIYIGKCDFMNDKKSCSKLIGKKLISGKLIEKKVKTYEDFIIGVDEDGREILYTCNPDKLANYFGKNPEAPNFMTAVFFKREVLNDYYSNPEKYTVTDYSISCGGLWSLNIENHHQKYVIVFLGYLGQSLSYKEQQRWKRFNITPGEYTISPVTWKRRFLGIPCDPEISDSYFKQKFELFQKEWHGKFGWHLFKPLKSEDIHCYEILRIPLTNNQVEFDQLVLSLTKLLIDSINVKEIKKQVDNTVVEKPKHIDWLEAFLSSQGFGDNELIGFIRNLQGLRSCGSAHRRDVNRVKRLLKELSDQPELSFVFDDILKKAVMTLDKLETYFLSDRKCEPG